MGMVIIPVFIVGFLVGLVLSGALGMAALGIAAAQTKRRVAAWLPVGPAFLIMTIAGYRFGSTVPFPEFAVNSPDADLGEFLALGFLYCLLVSGIPGIAALVACAFTVIMPRRKPKTRVNAQGQPINDYGEPIDEHGNPIDEHGNPIGDLPPAEPDTSAS